MKRTLLLTFLLLSVSALCFSQKLVEVAKGYSCTSVNTTVFRNNSLVTHGDEQYISYYDADGYLVLGKRKLNSKQWTLHRTQYRGNVKDAHNIISIMVDGEGYLHVSFDHHGHKLNYCRSIAPGSLEPVSYTHLDVYKRQGLDCDKLYALTFKIESVSDYVKQPKDTVLIMNLNLTNDFSGIYQMVAIRYTLTDNDEELTPSSVNMQRTLKAVNKNQARFFNVTQNSDLSPTGNITSEDYFNSIDNNGVTFTRQPDGTFTVAGWKNLSVSNGTVSFEDGTFTFCYDYESGGKRYRLRGTMTK